jgi:hypothetical protein
LNNFKISLFFLQENNKIEVRTHKDLHRRMSAVQQQQHQSSIVSPEDVASAMNAAFAEFLAVEPAAAAALLMHHQQNVNSTTLNEFLNNGTTHNNNDLSRNSRPPTPYAVTTHTYSGKNVFLFYF